MRRWPKVVAGMLALGCGWLHAQKPETPAYVATGPVSGVIRTWGSPQMGDLLRRYEAGFRRVQPGVRFQDDLKSTITAVAGVYTGRAEIGLLGREIWPTEVQAFASIKGHPPAVVEVATGSYDVPKATFALMIFVPKGNPLRSISVEQLAQVFEARPDGTAPTWGDLGLRGEWTHKPMHLYGFSRDNDKAQIFSQMVFRRGESWSCALKEFSNGTGPGGADAGERIVRAVANDPEGIGISNVHYATGGVRALAVKAFGTAAAVAPSKAAVADRSYPLTRAVYLVVDAGPGQELSAATREFLKFVLSRQGQQAVVEEGNYLPLPAGVALKELKKLEP